MTLKSYSDFLQNKLFEDSTSDWAKGNESFTKLFLEKIKPNVSKTISKYNSVNIDWYNTKTHSIIKRVGRTLIDSQEDFEEQIRNLVNFILNSDYEFIPKLKYDLLIKSKNCHFIFTYNIEKKDLYIVTVIPQRGTDCNEHFEID